MPSFKDDGVTRREALKIAGAAAAAGLLPALLSPARAQAPADPLAPVALDGGPAQAFASHRARANGLAWHFARTRPVEAIGGEANEDNTVALIAHFHVADITTGAEQEARQAAARAALRRLNRGAGEVGTFGKYDFALKGLMTIAHRYRGRLSEEDVRFILSDLVPPQIAGGHPQSVEFVEVSFLNIDLPETENHLLMTEGSRYLINQLHREFSPDDPRFDNVGNGLTGWLLGYLQTIAKHDFMEVNARPYARLSMHAVLNLYEFADDPLVRTAAQNVLDYTMVKYAVSSSRGRRVAPYRRLQPRINHQDNRSNWLYDSAGEQISGYFLACTGLTDERGAPAVFPASLDYTGMIGGTSSYRAPPAAYAIALTDVAPALHRFHQGTRPRVLRSPDVAQPALEIYFRSPSFLISAGGMFLNSGYGNDEYGQPIKPAWRDSARAQATTLIPARANVRFHDLLRFQPYPDRYVDPYAKAPNYDDDAAERWRTFGVNTGVAHGLAAGANMRPAEKITLTTTASSSAFPALAECDGGLFLAFKGSGNDNLNLARVLTTTLYDNLGVEGVEDKHILGEESDAAPALAGLGNRLFLAWKGSGNENLNLVFTTNGGRTFRGKSTFGDTSDHAPALAAHNDILFYGWTGEGDGNLNVAKVGFRPDATSVLVDKATLGETSDAAPALAAHLGRLFIAWRGTDDRLNLAFSGDDGRTFAGKMTFGETSDAAPALASSGGRLYLAWTGEDDKLNVARVVLFGNTAGGFGIEGLEGKVTLGETSDSAPALGSWNDLLFLGWTGEGEGLVNLRVSRDGGFATAGPWLFSDLGWGGFYIAAYRAPANGGEEDKPLGDLGFFYAVEKADMDARGMDFARFRALTMERNGHLPPRLDYGGTYAFNAPDDRVFSIWFQQTGDNHRARVVDLGERMERFDDLPLASGPYISAPGGHDGLVEIRRPGAEGAPLVLDSRDSLQPRRVDNRDADPTPWIERTLALFAIAPALDAQGRPLERAAALVEAAPLYDAMLRLNTDVHGPMLAPGVTQGLAAMGVDVTLSEAEAPELLEWLSNPDFTPYPALAQALLGLGRKLAAPVSIDVIAFNYEASGLPSPRRREEVQTPALQAAILAGFNERHGGGHSSFEAILAPI